MADIFRVLFSSCKILQVPYMSLCAAVKEKFSHGAITMKVNSAMAP